MSTLTKKLIGFGTATLAASTVGAFMAAAPAQAMKLSGSVTIDGPAKFNSSDPFPATDTIDFQNEQITDGTGFFKDMGMFGEFPTNLGLVKVKDLTLNQVAGTTYSYASVDKFIKFFNDLDMDGIPDDNVADLTFDLDPGEATRLFFGSPGNNNTILNFSTLKGTFKNADGQKVANGLLTAQGVGDARNFSIDLVVESVPEPATMLGLGVVAGSLALSRAGKKNKA